MQAVLGIDAAWTAGGSSGVALVFGEGNSWKCLRGCASYQEFIGGEQDLVSAATRLAGVEPAVVAIDMPLSRTPIVGRRASDQAISKAFGSRGCSTHTPSVLRPGAIGKALQTKFEDAGYTLATVGSESSGRDLIEVYPHPAILSLLAIDYRHPYKAGNLRRYWPLLTPVERRANLWEALGELYSGLRSVMDVTLPMLSPSASMIDLKAFEDMLDSLVCAWVGTRFLSGSCTAFGDDSSAVWVPSGD